MKATWKKSYGPMPYDASITPIQLPPPAPLPQLSEYLRLIRLHQPRVTLQEAQQQAQRVMKAAKRLPDRPTPDHWPNHN